MSQTDNSFPFDDSTTDEIFEGENANIHIKSGNVERKSKRINAMTYPSVYERAMRTAKRYNISLSEYITQLLDQHADD